MAASAPHPSVSVLVTTYNHAAYVEESLDSLRAQTTSSFEVVVIDDASTDGTADIIDAWLARHAFEATFVRNERNVGICANRNLALSLSSGELVCSLSGDDAYEPDRIRSQAACFSSLPEDVAVVYSDARLVGGQGEDLDRTCLEDNVIGAPPEGDVFAALLRQNFVPAPAAMVRRSAIAAVGGYDESLAFEDYDMWLRLSDRFAFHHHPGVLVRYRVLPTGMSQDAAWRHRLLSSELRVLESWADREGAGRLIRQHLWLRAVNHLLMEDGQNAALLLRRAASFDAGPAARVLAELGRTDRGRRVLRAAVIAARGFRHRWTPLQRLTPRVPS